jgi:RNA polymerase sigma factor (sigma-70 family)
LDNQKLLKIYAYANKISYRFEKLRFLRMDLVHEVILSLLEQPDKLNSILYPRSYVYRLMKWKRNDLLKSNQVKRTDNFIDSPIDSAEACEENTNWLDVHPQYNLNCSECHTDIEIVKDYIETKEFSKGNTREIFKLMLDGYSPKEISQKLNIGQHSVNQSVCNTRIKLNNHFRK